MSSQRFTQLASILAMPGMNGRQLAAAIKQQAPVLPVILLTGFGMFMDGEESVPAAVDLVWRAVVVAAAVAHKAQATLLMAALVAVRLSTRLRLRLPLQAAAA